MAYRAPGAELDRCIAGRGSLLLSLEVHLISTTLHGYGSSEIIPKAKDLHNEIEVGTVDSLIGPFTLESLVKAVPALG